MPGGGGYRTLRTEEFARHIESFTSHNDDLLAVEKLLRDGARKATKKVPLAVNDDLYICQIHSSVPFRNESREDNEGSAGAARTTGSKVDILLCHLFTRRIARIPRETTSRALGYTPGVSVVVDSRLVVVVVVQTTKAGLVAAT